jgi:hypothetical protein
MGIASLSFLAGTWRGEGTLRGDAVATSTVATPFGESMLRVDVETRRRGETVHRERIVFRERDGRLEATTSPWRGDAQIFSVSEEPGPRFVLSCGDLRWTIEASGADAFEERFGKLDGGRFEEIVALRHVRS